MMRSLSALAVSSLVLGAPATAQEAMLPQSDYRLKTEVVAGDSGTTVPMVMYHHEGKMRIETSFQGQSSAVLMDVNGESTTILINAQGMRMAMDVPVQEAPVEVPEAPKQLGEKISSDTVAGEACEVYRLPDTAEGEPGRMCMTSDNIVLRLSDEQGNRIFEAQEFERAAQDPSLFEVPAGYQRMQMPSGMGGMNIPGR